MAWWEGSRMSAEAYSLEVKQLTVRIRTLVTVFLSVWSLTALLGLVAANSTSDSSAGAYTVFVTAASAAVVATFYLQVQYFKTVRRREMVMDAFTYYMNRSGSGR